MNRWIFSTLKFILEEKEVTLLCCGCLTVFCARNPGMNKFCRLQSRMWFFLLLFAFSCSILTVWKWCGGYWVQTTSWDFCVLEGNDLGNSLWSSSYWNFITLARLSQRKCCQTSTLGRLSSLGVTRSESPELRGKQFFQTGAACECIDPRAGVCRKELSLGRCESEMLQYRAQVRLSMFSFKELWKS